MDVDSTNEIQDISLDGYDLSISKGSTVSLRPEVIAFRAVRTNASMVINAGDSAWLAFEAPKLEIGTVFNNSECKFTVPADGEGLYSFDITYDFTSSNQALRIFKNGIILETLFQNFNNLWRTFSPIYPLS